jgi:hypothetical protein
MTSIDSFDHSWQRYREMLADANTLNKAAVFDALAATGITAVTVDFDGEGDSGQIQGVAAQGDDCSVELPATAVTIRHAVWGRTVEITVRDHALKEAIEELCYGFLEHEHGGWENNDGAYGEFHFDVRARTIELDFNARYTDVYNSTYSW